MKSQRRLFFTIIILVIIAFAAFLLISRKRYLKDIWLLLRSQSTKPRMAWCIINISNL